MPSNHLILCRPLLLPSIFPSIRVFSSESALHIWWPKYCSFSFSIICSSECSGLILFKIERFDLLAFQGTLKSLLQHHSLKTSVLLHSAFFIVQLSHSYMTAGNMLGKFSTIMSSNIFSNLFFFFSWDLYSLTVGTFQSVQFSCSVVSNFLRPHGLQHASLLCSPSAGVCSKSCPGCHIGQQQHRKFSL